MEKLPRYLEIVRHYESCLRQHGDTHLGVDWPNEDDAQRRYQVMLEVIREVKAGPVVLLDFGCGTSHLYEYLRRHDFSHVSYMGLDISREYVDMSRRKFPHITYHCLDVMTHEEDMPETDYVVMNGVFTEKRGLSFNEMWAYFQQLIAKVFSKVKIGLAFNVMSKQVDWERDDLFHLPLDLLAAFLQTTISRHWLFRHDYGLHEYTVYVYKPAPPTLAR